MRGIMVLPAFAALLAACGSPEAEPGANLAVAPSAAAQAPATRSEPPPLPTATARTIPAAMLGVYDASLEACGTSSDARLTVSANELRFHESIGTVRKVTATGADAVTVEADYQGEGESWQNARELRLGDGGASLTVSGDGTGLVRVRCPKGAR